MMNDKVKYIALLRGINVGGKHKVPMIDLKNELLKLGFENVVTLLNSGNVIFDATIENISKLEKKISEHLEKPFGFSIPTIVLKSEVVNELLINNPFKNLELTIDNRLYVSFLRENDNTKLNLPWISSDNSYKIIEKRKKAIISVLDISISKTPKAMVDLEKYYGKDITTRNWNTINRIGKKLNVSP